MDKLNHLWKYILLFFVIYLGLSFLFSVESVRQGHIRFFNGFGQAVFNAINPSIYAEFDVYEGEETKDKFDVAISLYRQKKYGSRIENPIFRKSIKPSFIVNNSLRSLVIVPCILLISLIWATPNKIKSKLIGTVVGLIIYYIFITIYMSYRFENAFADGNFQPQSFWDYLVQFFGGYGLNEILYVVAVLIWMLVSLSPNAGKLNPKKA